jgi:hypothetical protein
MDSSVGFSLRLLTEEDVPALQRVYDAAPAAFTRLLGRPAAPEQAAIDITQALAEPARYQFGVLMDGSLIGMADCKLSEQDEGQASIGLLLLAEPYDDPAVAGLVLRILVRWLAQSLAIRRVQTAVPAQFPGEIAFWQAEGFEFTGEQYRRELGAYAPRFLVMARDLSEPAPPS